MKNATSIYIRQRVTGILLIPLSLWFAYVVKQLLLSNSESVNVIANIINSPGKLIAFILFASFGLYHGYLGLGNIIDDYIQCKTWNKVLKITLFLFSTITCLALTLLLLYTPELL